MNNFRQRLQNSSLGLLFISYSGLWFVITFGFGLATGSQALDPSSIGLRAVASLVFGGIMTGIAQIQRRRSGGIGVITGINAAIKIGRVPEDAEPTVWLAQLERRRSGLRAGRWANPVVFGIFTLVGVFLITTDPSRIWNYAPTALFIAAGVVTTVQGHRQLPKVEALLAQIRGQDGGASAPAPGYGPPDGFAR